MSREVLHDFDDGHGLTEAQRNTLGIWVPDAEDGYWCYGQFHGNGTYNTGCCVRHQVGADLIADADRIVSEDIPAGSNVLVTDGKFAGKDVRGAIGYIYEGTGAGQTFYIRRMIPGDNNKVEIALLSSVSARPRTPGWAAALANDSKFHLWFPGRFSLSAATAGQLHAGLVQTTLTVTDSYKPFGWVKCAGRAAGRLKSGFVALTDANAYVTPDANGELEGSGSPAIADFRDAIGRINMPVPQVSSTALLAEIALSIPNRRPSFSREGEGHSGNAVNIV